LVWNWILNLRSREFPVAIGVGDVEVVLTVEEKIVAACLTKHAAADGDGA
jgi:hypothetical protein